MVSFGRCVAMPTSKVSKNASVRHCVASVARLPGAASRAVDRSNMQSCSMSVIRGLDHAERQNLFAIASLQQQPCLELVRLRRRHSAQ